MADRRTDHQLDDAMWRTKPASANDATGAIPGMPADEQGIESVENMYDLPNTAR